MQDFDPKLFQLADMELDSWNADFTAFPPTSNNNAWNNHEDIFAPNYGFSVSPVPQSVSSSEQFRSSSLPYVTTFAEQVSPRQEQERQARPPGQLVRDAVYSDSHGIDFDIDQWLHSTTNREDHKHPQSQGAASSHMDMFKRNPFQQGLQNPLISRDQDYILYPDSPQFDWGLEPHQISRDIGSKEWLPHTGAESVTSKKCRVDASSFDQDSQGPASAGGGIPGSNYHVSGDQSKQFLELDEPYQYLPSPSPSDGSDEIKDISVSDTDASEAEGLHMIGRVPLRTSEPIEIYESRALRRESRPQVLSRWIGAGPRQYDVSVPGRSTVRRPLLSPGEPHNLRPVITAVVDVGFGSQSDQCGNTQFTRPQGSPMEMTMPVSR